MIDLLFKLAVYNTLGAAVLAIVAIAASLLIRRPALAHVLWLLVLVKLLTPPIWNLTWKTPAPVAIASAAETTITDRALPMRLPLEIEPPIAREISVSTPQPRPVHRPYWTLARLQIAAGVGWGLGSLTCAVVALLRMRRFRQLLKFADDAPPHVVEQTQRLGRRLELTKAPIVLFLPAHVSPMVVGFPFRPLLLLPTALWGRLSRGQRDMLLLHELAHLRRRDHWVRALELLVTIVHWWNPLLWIARRQLRVNEELCCDAWVMWAAPHGRESYAAALVETIDFACASRTPLPMLASGAGEFRCLQRRLLMIRHGNGKRNLGWTMIPACLVMAALPLSITRGQQSASTTQRTPATQPTASTSSGSKPTPQSLQAEARWQIQLGNYTEAMNKVQKILEIDPADKWANDLRLMVADRANLQKENERAMNARLDSVVPEINFDGVGFGDVIEFLRDVTGANIVVDWNSIETAGIDRNAPITLRLRNVKFREMMSLLLRSLPDGKPPLAMTSADDVIEIAPGNAPTSRAFPMHLEDHEARALLAVLDHKLPKVSFRGVAMGDVADFLRDVSGANLFINWKALEAAGIKRDSPVDLAVENVRVSKVLTLILNCLSNGKAQVGYTIENGVIVVTTADDLARNTFTRVYDIRDLLRGLDKDQSAAREEAILKMITQTIDSKSWHNNGGEGANARALQGQLIINQSSENQQAVLNLIERLRAVMQNGQLPTTQEAFPLLERR